MEKHSPSPCKQNLDDPRMLYAGGWLREHAEWAGMSMVASRRCKFIARSILHRLGTERVRLLASRANFHTSHAQHEPYGETKESVSRRSRHIRVHQLLLVRNALVWLYSTRCLPFAYADVQTHVWRSMIPSIHL